MSQAPLFLVSGIFELFSLTSGVPLFGAVRVGWIAVTYHLLSIALFVAMGVGLLVGKYWGYRAVLTGTILYTLDKVLFLLDRRTFEAYWAEQLSGNLEVLDLVDQDSLFQLMVLFSLLLGACCLGACCLGACWWGFALYLYLRRDYFRR